MCDCFDKNNSQLKRWTIVPSTSLFSDEEAEEVIKTCELKSSIMVQPNPLKGGELTEEAKQLYNRPMKFWNSFEELAEYQEKHGHNRD